jgi:phage-related tail fiber protein
MSDIARFTSERGLLVNFNGLLSKVSVKVFLGILVITLALTLSTAGLLTLSQTIPSTGTITSVNVGVYSDSACTQSLTSIDWGQVTPGSNALRTIYIKNTGNTPLTLSMATNTWNPSGASAYLTISWDKAGASLAVGQSIAAVLTLTVSPSISGITSFSVNIVITGSG